MSLAETTATNGHAPQPAPKPPAPNPFDALWDATRKGQFYERGLRESLAERNAMMLAVAELMQAAEADLVVDGERVYLLVYPVGGGQPHVRVKQGTYLHTLDGLIRTQAEARAQAPTHRDGAHACCDPRLPEPDDEAIDEAAAFAAVADLQAAVRCERNALSALDRCVMGDGATRPPSDDVEPAGDADELRGFGARLTRAGATAR